MGAVAPIFKLPAAGAIGRSMQERLAETIYVNDFDRYKGDGEHDARPAIQDAFDYAASTTSLKRIVFQPTNYYSLQSRYSADAVLRLTCPVIIEGPGMRILTMKYDGTDAATALLDTPNGDASFSKISDMYIEASESLIQNIIQFANTNICTLERNYLRYAANACVTGFNWMTEVRHCWFHDAPIGLDNISTTAFVANNYCKNNTYGFKIFCIYGVYLGNAVDFADVAYKLDEPWSVVLEGNGCEQCDQAIVGRALAINIAGFTIDQTGMDPEALPDYVIDLGQGPSGSNATISGFYGKAVTPYDIKADYKVTITDNSIPRSRIYQGSDPVNSPHTPALVVGYTSPTYSTSDFESTLETIYSNTEVVQGINVIFNGGTVSVEQLAMSNLSGAGSLIIYGNNSVVTFTNQVGNDGDDHGNGILLTDCQTTIVFRDFHFVRACAGALIRMYRCRDVRFINCTLEDTVSGTSYVLAPDEFSNVTVDKATMDAMTQSGSGGWDQLTGRPSLVRFTGYTSVPTAGTFSNGCRVDNATPAAGSYAGWVLVSGAWKGFGAVES